MTEAMFPRSVVMAAGSEGFQRGWTEAVAACIAAVEALESLLDMDKGEGGYDCCGCSTPSALYDDAIAVLRDLRPSST
jgi:hypothetical protein